MAIDPAIPGRARPRRRRPAKPKAIKAKNRTHGRVTGDTVVPGSRTGKSSRKRTRSAAGTRHTTKLHAPRSAKGARITAARHPRPHKLRKLKSNFNKFSTNPADRFVQTTITPDTPPPGHHKGTTKIKPP
jgi:hypothetical protein